MQEMWICIGIFFLSIFAALAYRAGGSGDCPFWFREVGMMTSVTIGLIMFGVLDWTLILTAGSTYGAQTSYFKKKWSDAKWWNWLFVGLAFSLAVLPVVIYHNLWHGFFLRTLLVTLFTAAWSEEIGIDVWEERGRGYIQIISLPILFI